MTFKDFAAANRKRCEEDFHRTVVPTSAFAFVLGVAEEAGEVAGAVRACLGITKRKSATVEQTLAIPPPPRRWIVLVYERGPLVAWSTRASAEPPWVSEREEAEQAAGAVGGQVADYDLWLRGGGR